MKRAPAFIAYVLAAVLMSPSGYISASSHREAPITALDQKADITDVYAFRSYGPSATIPKVTLVLDVDPFLEPANGPNWFPFDPNVLYEIEIDNNNDAEEDIVFQFRFSSPQFTLPGVYTTLAGFDGGAIDPVTSKLAVPPQITDFSNPGLNGRQTYSVTMIKKGISSAITSSDGSPFFAVPANAGPRTMNYGALFGLATYTNLNLPGVSVFAGTVDDPFFIDLGAAFDTGNLRAGASGIPGVLTDSEDGAAQNFAPDTVSGYAVNAIAIEVPVAMLTRSGRVEPASSPAATIGVWGATYRPRVTVRRNGRRVSGANEASFRQVQREGNPLINELIIGTGSKDRWSMDQPKNDAQFANFLLDPPFVHIINSLYNALLPGALTVPSAPRNDLLPLVTYAPPIAAKGTPAGPVADLLRLNTGVDPTLPSVASRLGLIGGDPAGFPNGRRLFDDVVDITLRVVVGGVLTNDANGNSLNRFPNNRLGDGVNVNDAPFRSDFPYLADCPSGRNRVHIDPGDAGCTGGAGPNCVN